MAFELGDNEVKLAKCNGCFLNLIVPKRDVRNVKQALERHDLLDKTLKIIPLKGEDSRLVSTAPYNIDDLKLRLEAWKPLEGTKSAGVSNSDRNEGIVLSHTSPQQLGISEKKFVIPTVFEVPCTKRQDDMTQAQRARDTVLQTIGLSKQIDVECQLTFRRRTAKHSEDSAKSVLAQAVRIWLHCLPSTVRSILPLDLDDLVIGSKWAYIKYPPMLLLPPSFMSRDPWPTLLAGPLKPHLPGLYSMLSERLKVTHIAKLGPIPAKVPIISSNVHDKALGLNCLRSPSNLTPVYGDFGKPHLPPRKQNLDNAFWVRTVQNDITQTWAPLYTMFSRGNLSEKARMLRFKSPTCPYELGGPLRGASGSTAVDLYAGIGYFAFCYAKAGVDKVLCFDINGWSIEGLRRGAEANGWATRIIEPGSSGEDPSMWKLPLDEQFIVFQESNKYAGMRVGQLRDRIPPVRHINCGYLPSSSDSWPTAMNCLDHSEGGWIHAHENVRIEDIEQRRIEVVRRFTSLVTLKGDFDVSCNHVEQVKTYAPGIMHCVFDIYVSPKDSEHSQNIRSPRRG